jgi:5-hydroxyisourate hydrolase
MGISTHILDTALGHPAIGVPVTLSQQVDGAWLSINEALTDANGRCKYLLPETQLLHQGTYRIRFDTSTYYKHQQLRGLYPYIEIVFEITNSEQHYHIPLLLTANGYTTYRGS